MGLGTNNILTQNLSSFLSWKSRQLSSYSIQDSVTGTYKLRDGLGENCLSLDHCFCTSLVPSGTSTSLYINEIKLTPSWQKSSPSALHVTVINREFYENSLLTVS